MKLFVYIILAMLPFASVAQDGMQQGDSAYAAGNYAAAIAAYEKILSDEGEAPEIYYNLGNAYYKNNEIARAILNYERALLLAPSDEDIIFNLELARSKTVDKVSSRYNIFIVEWYNAVVNSMSLNAWTILGIVSFVLFLLALSLYFFSSSISLRKVGFAIAVSAIIITIFANCAAYSHYNMLTSREYAIILSPSVTAKSTPDDSGTNLFVIHEGHKVKVIDNSMTAWKEIELEDGTIGWVPSKTLEFI